MKKQLITLFTVSLFLSATAQKKDTVLITPSMLNTRVLIRGNHQWLVYFKMGKDSTRKMFNIWNRTIDMIEYQGRPAILVKQTWEDKDTITHTAYSISDRTSFVPLYHTSWFKQTGSKVEVDFLKKQLFVNDQAVMATDTAMAKKRRWLAFDTAMSESVWNWHLDLETFPLLPFKINRTFLINFFEPGFPLSPKPVAYTVTGSKLLNGYDNQQVDCWILEHVEKNNREVYWISKKTKEVLKLEQEFAGRFRYKVKLAFSN